MTTELQTKVQQIKEQCRKAIELGEAATAGPWKADRKFFGVQQKSSELLVIRATNAFRSFDNNLDHIAHARTFSPAAAQALLVAIEALEGMEQPHISAEQEAIHAALEQICREWPE